MSEKKDLSYFLKGILEELNKLEKQIKETQDYSRQAETILCLRELVIEQIGSIKGEDTRHPTHASR